MTTALGSAAADCHIGQIDANRARQYHCIKPGALRRRRRADCGGHTPLVEANVISDNVSVEGNGGGIDGNSQCGAHIARNVITGNETGENDEGYGAGISCDGSSPQIESNLIAANSATGWLSAGRGGHGGGIFIGASSQDASPVIANNTLVANHADFGGGIAVGTQAGSGFGRMSPQIVRNILVGNLYGGLKAGGEAIYMGSESTLRSKIDYNDFWSNQGGKYGGWANSATIGTGNLEADPVFVQGPLDAYCLSQSVSG